MGRGTRGMLEDIVVYMVSRFPRGVGRVRLMKLLYLVDVLARRELGRPVTGVRWSIRPYGPFSRRVLEVLKELSLEGRLVCGEECLTLEEPPELPAEVRGVVDRVVEEYGFLPMKELAGRVGGGRYTEERAWDGEILELAERAASDHGALVELTGRLRDAYGEAFKVLPASALTLYAFAVSHLSSSDVGRAKVLTLKLLGLLEEADAHVRERGAGSPLPPELRGKVRDVYRELVDAVAEAVSG